MREKFIDLRFSEATLSIIATANHIIDEYLNQGYRLTLRQLYYQFVARGLRENTERSYKSLGDTISNGRLAGLIDWDAIEDRGREIQQLSHWDSPNEMLQVAAQQFRLDKWQDQPHRILVMVEKQALEGVLLPVCQRLDIPFCANKGYSSSTALYNLGLELRYDDRFPIVIYLGDHDPSGLDMTRDVEERLRLFSDRHVDVVRVALNIDQVEALNVPENPTKLTDARAAAYVQKFGSSSWELDAIPPQELAQLVTTEVLKHRDEDLWNAAVESEQRMRTEMQDLAENHKF